MVVKGAKYTAVERPIEELRAQNQTQSKAPANNVLFHVATFDGVQQLKSSSQREAAWAMVCC